MKSKHDLEAVYQKAPIFMQHLFVSIEGWRIQKRRYNKKFQENLTFLQNNEVRLRKDCQGLQKEKLYRFFSQAKASLFWAERFRRLHLKPDPEKIFDQLAELPVLSKNEVKEKVDEIATPGFAKEDLIISQTSGTTGSGLVFPGAKEAEQIQWATWWRYRSWHGIHPGWWCGYFGGRSLVGLEQKKPPYWRINYPGRQIMFSAYHLSEKTAWDYLGAINAGKVPWLHGYPSTLSLLAKFKLDQNLPETPHLRIITTGAENLLPHQKILLEKAFGVSVRQHYGQAEGVANISECEHGHLHVDEDFSFVEFLPLESDASSCRIIGTNWSNPAFPLFRYDTGDIATLSEKGCPCGRPGRIVQRIDGRAEDFVVLPNGARIGRLDHIFKDMIRIREAQVVQTETGSVLLRVVPGQNYNCLDDEQKLLAETRKRLGGELKMSVEYVEKLPRTSSGKLRFVVSELPDEKI
jgi:phenylacetate-CoA ligase